jgi:hypothetical protein
MRRRIAAARSTSAAMATAKSGMVIGLLPSGSVSS